MEFRPEFVKSIKDNLNMRPEIIEVLEEHSSRPNEESDKEKNTVESVEIDEITIEELEKEMEQASIEAIAFSGEIEAMTHNENLPENYDSIKDKLIGYLSHVKGSCEKVYKKYAVLGLTTVGMTAVGSYYLSKIESSGFSGEKKAVIAIMIASAAAVSIAAMVDVWKENMEKSNIRKKISKS